MVGISISFVGHQNSLRHEMLQVPDEFCWIATCDQWIVKPWTNQALSSGAARTGGHEKKKLVQLFRNRDGTLLRFQLAPVVRR